VFSFKGHQRAPRLFHRILTIRRKLIGKFLGGLRHYLACELGKLSAVPEIDRHHFDYLAAVLFNADISVLKGCLIPYGVLQLYATHTEHTNSHRFLSRDVVWSLPGVQDITEALKAAERLAVTDPLPKTRRSGPPGLLSRGGS
jgi:hypothetical protein